MEGKRGWEEKISPPIQGFLSLSGASVTWSNHPDVMGVGGGGVLRMEGEDTLAMLAAAPAPCLHSASTHGFRCSSLTWKLIFRGLGDFTEFI